MSPPLTRSRRAPLGEISGNNIASDICVTIDESIDNDNNNHDYNCDDAPGATTPVVVDDDNSSTTSSAVEDVREELMKGCDGGMSFLRFRSAPPLR